MRNNLDGDSFRFRARLVADVMYVSAAYVSEALPYSVGGGRAIVLVNRDRSFCHCDQTGTGMGVPPTLAPGLEGVLGDVEVGVAAEAAARAGRCGGRRGDGRGCLPEGGRSAASPAGCFYTSS